MPVEMENTMVRHILKAVRSASLGMWVLIDTNQGNLVLGEEKPYIYKSRKNAYIAASCMFPENSVWNGRKVASGYSIDVS